MARRRFQRDPQNESDSYLPNISQPGGYGYGPGRTVFNQPPGGGTGGGGGTLGPPSGTPPPDAPVGPVDPKMGGASNLAKVNWAALGLGALGDALQAMFARPLFQERSPFTGSASAQSMQEKGVAGMEGLKGQLDARGPFQFSPDVAAENPMGGMSDDPIRKILQGLK